MDKESRNVTVVTDIIEKKELELNLNYLINKENNLLLITTIQLIVFEQFILKLVQDMPERINFYS